MEASSEQDGLSKEEREQMNKQRTRGLTRLQKMAYIQMGLGVIACTVGVVSIVYGAEGTPHWPYVAGFGLWIGVLEIIIAIFGILAASEGIGKDEVSVKLKTFVIVNYVFCLVSFSPCILSIVWSSNAISFCQNEGDVKNYFKCFPNKDAKIATSIVTILMAVAVGILSIFGAIFFCCYGRTFGFKSKRERRLERQVRILAAQVQTIQNAPPQNNVLPVGEPIKDNRYYQWDQKY